MGRQDIQHYDLEEVEAIIVQALDLVLSLELPEHLQAVAFTQAAAMIGAKTVQITQAQPVAFDLRAGLPKGR